MRTLLKALRERDGRNQTEIAYLARTTQSRLSLAESGRGKIGRPTLARLAVLLNFDGELEALLGPAPSDEQPGGGER